jgi:hypothetical protein
MQQWNFFYFSPKMLSNHHVHGHGSVPTPMVLAFVLVSMVVCHVPKKLAGGCAGEGVVLGGVGVEGGALEPWPLVGEPDAEVTLVLFSNGSQQGSETSGGERGERHTDMGEKGRKGRMTHMRKGG